MEREKKMCRVELWRTKSHAETIWPVTKPTPHVASPLAREALTFVSMLFRIGHCGDRHSGRAADRRRDIDCGESERGRIGARPRASAQSPHSHVAREERSSMPRGHHPEAIAARA